MRNLQDIQLLKEFDQLEFIAREVVEGFITGLHRSPFHGFSVEFAEHRLYNQGESTKHIDWKLYARTEKLFVKRYEEETNLRCHLIIDTSSSMLYPYQEKLNNKLDFSIYSAAALIYLLRRQRDAVGLSFFSDEIDFRSEARLSAPHVNLLFARLNELLIHKSTYTPKGTSASQSLHLLAESYHQRSLVIIFSDMISQENPDDIFSALQHLRHNKHEVILFHVTDPKEERDFDFQNKPFRFVDLETKQEIKVNPNEIRDQYRAAMSSWFNELKLRCGQYHIDLIEADIRQNFDQILTAYLIKRSKLM
jgi:uncharacterized protein (DUF58 family)